MQYFPLISEDILSKTNKVLFITHLAIGDFTYLQNYFKAFSEKYPHIKIDLWIDEVRRTWFFWRWKSLKKYSLYDWVSACPFFNKIYTQTYSPFAFRKSLKEANEEQYPVIISLCTLRSKMYARYARCISPKGLIVGVVNTPEDSSEAFNGVILRPQDKEVLKDWHITDFYAFYFERLFGLCVPPTKRFPFINIPKKWQPFGRAQLRKWDILSDDSNKFVVFLNSFAKTKKRSWPLDSLIELMIKIKAKNPNLNFYFIVNSTPEEFLMVERFFSRKEVKNVFVFSAQNNFFELPSLISSVDLVISVETAIMHLATALKIPVVALMRRKTPEWAPYDKENSRIVFAPGRGWVKAIGVSEVLEEVSKFKHEMVEKKAKKTVLQKQ
jgi:ADP-heptose:LPS heptosyltransferase